MSNARTSALDHIRIASPCSMSWDDMEGDDRVRHCSQCAKNVFNLAGMEREAAESLLKSRLGSGERLCVRLHRRADGTVLTADCPVGLRAARQRAARMARGVAALIAMLAATVGALALGHRKEGAAAPIGSIEPFSTLCSKIAPGRTPPPQPPTCVMGAIALPVLPADGRAAPGAGQ